MPLSTQPYKGARDFYPEDKRLQKYIFGKLRQVVERFGYDEYDAPLLEPFEIYAAKSGEELVNEQIYSFEDRGGRKIAIRPEMTPSVSRMVAARRQELAYPLRWYSIPNLWRYERPQRGRLREHYQLNVDVFGVEGIEAEHEIILIADSILKALGAKPKMYEIRINSRKHLNEQLDNLGLSSEQKHQCLQLLDRQAKIDPEEFKISFKEIVGEDKARQLLDFLENRQAPEAMSKLLDLLSNSGVSSAVFDPNIIRGLEYYTDIVFEVFDTDPENNRAMFGGGRYDGLVAEFGVEPVPTVGFGMGDVTLKNFLEGHKLLPKLESEIEARIILIGDVYKQAQPLLAKLRQKMNVAIDLTDRKIDNKIRAAEKAGVKEVIFIGEKEVASNSARVKDLSSGKEKELQL